MLSLPKHLYRFVKTLIEAVEMLRQAQHDLFYCPKQLLVEDAL